jgi:hypothetical protein
LAPKANAADGSPRGPHVRRESGHVRIRVQLRETSAISGEKEAVEFWPNLARPRLMFRAIDG